MLLRMAVNPQTYDAFAQHPSLPGGEAAGKLSFRDSRLRFEAPGISLEIPLSRLEIDLDNQDETQRIDLSDPQLAEWLFYTFDEDILAARPMRQQTHTRNQLREFKSAGELQRRLKLTGWVLLFFALLVCGGSLALGFMVRALVNRIPPQWEQKIGDAALQEIQSYSPFITNAALQARLDQATAPLLKGLPGNVTNLTFHLSENPIPNAMALPGGHVIVNAGLMELAETPEEISGVIAHELAHVIHKHAFRKLISDAGPFLVLRLFFRDQGGLFGLLGGGSEFLIRQSFSQDFEREADASAWDYLIASKINPRGYITMLAKLKQEEEKFARLMPETGSMRSHPPTQRRIDKLEAKWSTLKDKTGFLNLRQTSAP
jgi:Zn-dependent protease with chaperone function